MAGAEEIELLSRMGIKALPSATHFAHLGQLISRGQTQSVVAAVDWSNFRSLVELQRPKPLLAELGQTTATDEANPAGPAPVLVTWENLAEAERTHTVMIWLQERLAEVLGRKFHQLPSPRTGFFELGIDSLLAVEYRNRLARELRQSLPATLVFDHANILALTDYLLAKLWPKASRRVTAPVAAPSSSLPTVKANATNEDIDAALEARLARLESLTRDN